MKVGGQLHALAALLRGKITCTTEEEARMAPRARMDGLEKRKIPR
jgi:hypothetical protein